MLPQSFPFSLASSPKDLQSHAVVGDDAATEFCCLYENGTVICIDPEEVLPICFVNSNLEKLSSFIKAYDRFISKPLDEANPVNIATKLRKSLYPIDHKALEKDSWWSCILRSIEEGFF